MRSSGKAQGEMRRESKVEVKKCARFIFYVKDWTGKAGSTSHAKPCKSVTSLSFAS